MTVGTARMDDWTAGDYGGLIGGGIVMLGAIGKGLAWLLNWQGARSDRREAKLTKWEASLTERERDYRHQIEDKLGSLERANRLVAIALLDVTLELKHFAPLSPAVARAFETLRELMPADFEMNPQMRAAVEQLDKVGEGE